MRLTKHPEVTTIQESETFHLRDGISIQVQGLPPDYDDTAETELPSPEPARLGIEKDGKGKAVLDDNGRTVMRYDTEDPEYKRAVTENNKLIGIKLFVDGISPGELEFDATPGDDFPAYYRAVMGELKAFGWTMGDVLRVAKRVSALSNISDEDMKVAEADFTEAESSPSAT